MTDAGGAKTRRATLADVAARAGVAPSTVSRALAVPGRGNRNTRERILRIAEELDYPSGGSDDPLTAARTRAIAVLVSDITNPFYFGIVRGTQHELRTAGYSQLLVHTEESEELEESMLADLRGSVEGVILAAPRMDDKKLRGLAATMPTVAINRSVESVPSVFIDTPRGFEQSIEHLVSLGHRSICYVSGPANSRASSSRWRAVRSAGRRLGAETFKTGPFSPRMRDGAAAADAALNTGATAAVTFNALLAIGMLTRFRERGVDVPTDMSIVGCDDIFGADFCSPPLTTLSAPIEQTGRVAVAILLGQLNRRDDRPHGRQTAALPTHLTVRASTGSAPRRGKQ